jgi:chaperonin GroES
VKRCGKSAPVLRFSKFAGTEVKVDGEELIIIKLADVLAVIE